MSSITITYLQMFSPGDLRFREISDPDFQVLEAKVKQWRMNWFFYVAVGEHWCWHERRSWTEGQWKNYAESENLRTFGAYWGGSPAGYFELQHSPENEIEIISFGLLPAFFGKGLGGAMLTQAIREAWKMNPKRLWLHTCTLDHPKALANYLARGFQVYKTEERP